MNDPATLEKHKKLWALMEEQRNIDVAALRRAFAHHMEYTVGKYREGIQKADVYQALAYTVRDFLIDRWNETQQEVKRRRTRRVYYLSMEFLMGRLLVTNLVNVGMREIADQNLAEFGYTLEEIMEYEPDAGLGNGGLGRLAACFLDSMATLDLPCSGSTIRYEFGIFHQQILNGYQKEAPDDWLSRGNPWEIMRGDILYPVNFYGHTEQYVDDTGTVRTRWLPGDSVMAMAYDILVPGYGTRTVNNLRLWQSRASDEFNFEYFNHGDYLKAVEDKQRSESISKVLYPNENVLQGKELRLKQEYMLVSATIQDAIAHFVIEEGEDWDRLPERVFFQMNDTHPALAVPELMRILMDLQGVSRDRAWAITSKCMAYTNHTVMPEALEKWDLGLFGNLLPRHLEIIYDINHQFLQERITAGASPEEIAAVSIIDEGPPKRVRMANLAVVGSTCVNGVAAIHTDIIRKQLFADFHRIWPDKIQNKTNGITHRRWIVASNPELTALIEGQIGSDWIRDLEKLRGLEKVADDSGFQEDWQRIRKLNKERLAHIIGFECGVHVDPESIFDIQVKRIHEYKRQHLNILRVIADYQAIKANPSRDYTPRTVLFAGKAAPGYHRAKMIIKLINCVANIVNRDPDVADRLKVAFLPNYRVSLAERIFPAADLSEQISTAGMEASGTGNMKFMLNGSLTVGTLDGANIEIMEEAGEENIYIFGKTVEQLEEMRAAGSYDPVGIYRNEETVHHVLNALTGNYFNRQEPGLFQELFHTMVYGGDYYYVLADFMDYVKIQNQIGLDFVDRRSWTRKAILNTARSGKFSSDRTIAEYAKQIWHVEPVEQRSPRIKPDAGA